MSTTITLYRIFCHEDKDPVPIIQSSGIIRPTTALTNVMRLYIVYTEYLAHTYSNTGKYEVLSVLRTHDEFEPQEIRTKEDIC